MIKLLFTLSLFASAANLLQDVKLEDAKGISVTAASIPKGKITVFVAASTNCPILRKYVPVLNELRKKWKDRGVEFYLIGLAAHDDNRALQKELRSFQAKVPAYFDNGQVLVKRLGLDTITKVAVVDGKSGELLLTGAIDDQFGTGGRKPQMPTHYLDLNLEALLNGKKAPFPETRAYGCAITVR